MALSEPRPSSAGGKVKLVPVAPWTFPPLLTPPVLPSCLSDTLPFLGSIPAAAHHTPSYRVPYLPLTKTAFQSLVLSASLNSLWTPSTALPPPQPGTSSQFLNRPSLL